MPKYLLQVSYTAEGAKGLVKDGGSKRRDAARSLIESLGGKLECFYFAFGDTDVFAIADMPDHATMTSAALAVTASGAASGKTTILMSPEEIDQAMSKQVRYTPPGR